MTSPAPEEVYGFQDELHLEWTPRDASNVMGIWLTRSINDLILTF